VPLDNQFGFPQYLFSRGCGARGDLGQLAPRKKLLKSTSSFPELSENPPCTLWHGGIFIYPLRAALIAYVRCHCRQIRNKVRYG